MTPIVGNEVVYRYCSYQDPGPSGAGQTWDFSTAVTAETHSVLFTTPGSTPNGGDFPGATYATEYDAPSDIYGYVEVNAAGGFGLGSDLGVFGNTHFSDTKQDLKFPLSFGDSWSDTFFGDLVSIGSTGTVEGTISGEADGYGTLILPWGTIANVLRVHLQTTTLQTVLTPPPGGTNTVNESAYYFYKPGIQTQLANTSVANTSSFIYLDQGSVGFPGSIEQAIGISVAPNPAEHEISFFFGAEGHVRAGIINALGQEVRTADLGFRAPGIHRHVIGLDGLSSGHYLLRVISDDGQRGSRPFMVQR